MTDGALMGLSRTVEKERLSSGYDRSECYRFEKRARVLRPHSDERMRVSVPLRKYLE